MKWISQEQKVEEGVLKRVKKKRTQGGENFNLVAFLPQASKFVGVL